MFLVAVSACREDETETQGTTTSTPTGSGGGATTTSGSDPGGGTTSSGTPTGTATGSGGSGAGGGATGDWVYEQVDAAANTALGFETSIAVDSQGRPRIAYYDLTNEQLLFASRDSGTWSVEVVDSDGDAGVVTALAIGSDDQPQIAYFAFTSEDLRYARKGSTGTWTKENVATSGPQGRGLALALDSANAPFISYLDESSTALRLARRPTASWTTELVDADDGNNTSIGVEANGTIHIAYFAWIQGEVRHAWGTPGSFSTELAVAFSGDGWQYNTALALAGGAPHVVYDDPDGRDLGYATKSGGSWSDELLDTSGDVGSDADIAIDANGDLHVIYFAYTAGELRYAFGHDGDWSTTTLRDVGDAGGEPSIAVDAGGHLHVAFQDATGDDGELWYAHR